MNYLLYIVFGNRNDLYKELIYSLLSFQEVSTETTRKNTQIIIHSNKNIHLPNSLEDLRINFHLLAENEISESAKKNNGYYFALKAKVLQNFFISNTTGNVLLIDTDTFFIKDPKELFELVKKGQFIMHLKEHKIYRRPVMKAYLSSKIFKTIEGQPFNIKPNIALWNSGVIGFNQSFLPQLESVLYLIEQLSRDNISHVLEQLSFSYFFQINGRINSADNYLVHYYFSKTFAIVLGSYFNQTFDDDRETLNEMTQMNLVPEQIKYNHFSKILINITKNSRLMEWHFFCLPWNTHIGKVLWKEILFDKRFYKILISVFFKKLFNTYKMREYNLKEFETLRTDFSEVKY